ncbi:PREDICTED: queuine tRNA-ribosyltransferase subunit QTRTD1 homolog [Polistes dominula]|uniref:Queuine tRNA-ribosyltransferase accessory subunit 2 n=1 Tax=Polistes dominula TaxID=743375 RepID=A0ABM1IRQ6_POLDO|nr:PREDICTED: queuine tRNA-ribosyltransferase subunit QTRTD1 homolog [Polistes dominula]
MKFILDSLTHCAPRIGTLKDFERLPSAVFETPLLLIYTKRGSVPHLTKDVFKTVTKQQHLLSISLPSTLKMEECIKKLNVSFAEFVSMKEYINFLSIQDPTETTPLGFQQADSISVWSREGRSIFTADKYMDLVESFEPDLYVALCDGNKHDSKKRISKAMCRSKTLTDQCLRRHAASNKLKSKSILGAVEGGYDLQIRKESVEYLIDKPLAGFVIDGLHQNGPDVKDIQLKQIKNVIEHTINLLPADKLRVSLGCWNPLVTLELINLGIDIFDSSYPYIITERSEALTFLCDHDSCKNISHVLNFSEKSYKDDFSPICEHCECLTCKNHTRAYLHHLQMTKELLGMVLLMIHNMHHYIEFFKLIRQSIKEDKFNQFREKINLKFTKEDS